MIYHTQLRGTDNSIIVFTLHKSASMFLHLLCTYLSEQCNMEYHSPNNHGSALNPSALLRDKSIWLTRHGCFAPLRFYVNVPDIDTYRIILHLRDPRDVLVSMYFSYCFIHSGPVAGNAGYRKKVAEAGIDAFVLTKAREEGASSYIGDCGTGGSLQDLTGGIVKKYRDYIDNLVGRHNVILVKYEEMVSDFPGWLDKFMAPFQLANKNEIRNHLIALSPQFFPKRTQDVMHHVRRVTPGDHKNKLKPKTIAELNTIFADILETLGYE